MAKSEKEILGHIDCPSCGTAKGMRVTHDKNGEPFGYCEAECGQQLRVGGDRHRVKAFLARFPWAAKTDKSDDRTVADLANDLRSAGFTTASAVHEDKPAPVTVTVPRSPFADALKMLGA